MPLYTFYFCKPDGSSTSFEAHERRSDADARELADQLLEDHSSCAYVAVWASNRPVSSRSRAIAPGRSYDRRAAG
jgi:hypothetical protein